MKRSLTLKSEHLADLSAGDLSDVGGGAVKAPSGLTCPLQDCFVDSNLGMCWTWVC